MPALSARAGIQPATTSDDRAGSAAHLRTAVTFPTLPLLPRQSLGVLTAPLGELTVLYDLVTEVVHVLNASAAYVWFACDGSTDVSDASAPVVEATGADRAAIERDVTMAVDRFVAAGLVGRTTRPPSPTTFESEAVTGLAHGAVHAVLDDGVRFHAGDAALLAQIDERLGFEDERVATIDLRVQDVADGTVHLDGWGPRRTYGSRAALLEALPSALNQIAASTSTCVTLHAAVARSPTGEVVLLPARSGSGKTTLAAALLRDGWDYGSDEAVGVRAGSLIAVAYPKPLVLGPESQALLDLPPTGTVNVLPAMIRADAAVLRGEVGPVGRVVLPHYEAGAAVSVNELEPRDAAIGIIEHCLNLARVGQAGLEALCQLAVEVPVHRLVHGGVADAIPAIEALLGDG
jgi:hypothetical protein